MNCRHFVAALALSFVLGGPAFAQTTTQDTTPTPNAPSTDKQVSQDKKAEKDQVKADKAEKKAATTKQGKKAAKAQEKADKAKEKAATTTQ